MKPFCDQTVTTRTGRQQHHITVIEPAREALHVIQRAYHGMRVLYAAELD